MDYDAIERDLDHEALLEPGVAKAFSVWLRNAGDNPVFITHEEDGHLTARATGLLPFLIGRVHCLEDENG